MLATLSRLSLLTVALTSVGTSVMQMPPVPVPVPVAAAPDTSIAAALAQWRAVRDTSQLPFDMYADFLLAHPGWPGEAAIRRAAEGQAGTASPTSLVHYFRAFAPLTGAGRAAYVRALEATGDGVAAREQARLAWRGNTLLLADESWLRQNYAGSLSPADHDARMDLLLWSNQTSAAARQLPYVSASGQPVLAARLALRSNGAGASDAAAASDRFGSDAGYIADRAIWLRSNGAGPSARAWLAQPRRLTAPPGNAEEYLEVLLTAARGAAADGQWQVAYDIARQVDDAFAPGTDVARRDYGERDDYTSVAWLGAQAAVRLGRHADAMTLFERYGRGTPTPSTRSKGLYWAARSADRAGLPADASRLWSATAGYRESFYGQLANEHLGRALTAPPAGTMRRVDAMTRLAWGQRELVRAARMLGTVGLYDEQTAFVRQISLDAKSDADHLMGFDLARELQRPDLGVMIGRSALLNGLGDYSAGGYPTVAVPAGFEGDWTMIHAIGRQESQFNRTAISSAGARGLMQIMPGTAREQAGKMGLTYTPAALAGDPDLSMKLGAGYFRRVYGGFASYPLTIAAYNAGPGNVNKWLRLNGDPRTGSIDMVDWIEAIPLQETRNYVQRVLENAVVYDLMRSDRANSRGPANLSWYLGRRPS